MQRKAWDAFLFVDVRNVYYLEGVLHPRGSSVLLWVDLGNAPILVTDSKATPAQAEIIELESYSPRRVIDHVWEDAMRLLIERVKSRAVGKIAVEKDALNGIVLDGLQNWFPHSEIQDGSDAIADLRRARDPDEVDILRRMAKVADAGFVRAREIVRPGISEVDLYLEICRAMVKEAGRPLEVRGDFATGLRSLKEGGVPIERTLEPGELCVFDLSPIGWGYQADLCRTVAVGEPSRPQQDG